MNSTRIVITVIAAIMMMFSTVFAQTMKITAYTNADGYGYPGACACDFLNPGETLTIAGVGTLTVVGTIGDGSSNHVDVWMDSTAAAYAWGEQYRDVEW